MRRTLLALVLAVLVLGCGGGDSGEAAESSAVAVDEGAQGLGVGDAASQAAPEPAEEESAAEDPDGGAATLPAPLDSAVGDRIIKEGTVSIEVEAGTFDASYAEVVEEARRLGGTVVSSTTTTSDDGGTSGSVTVRVPVENYEDLLVGVGGIGEVRGREITAQDVSEEFVDLQSRQRNLEAQERFYLGLLEEAAGVQDAIAVQQQLNGITEQLEQVKGRSAYLDERTSYSTLTAQLFEPGGAVALAEDPQAGPDLGRFVTLARNAFVNVVGAALVVGGFLGPFALLGLLAVLVARLLPRRAARPAPPLPPAARPETEREREPVG